MRRAGGAGTGWRAADRVAAIGGTEIPVEALLEILEAVFEGICEWRKVRKEQGESAPETVVLGGQQGGQPDGDPYSYQLGGRPEPQDSQDSQGTSSRRGIRQ